MDRLGHFSGIIGTRSTIHRLVMFMICGGVICKKNIHVIYLCRMIGMAITYCSGNTRYDKTNPRRCFSTSSTNPVSARDMDWWWWFDYLQSHHCHPFAAHPSYSFGARPLEFKLINRDTIIQNRDLHYTWDSLGGGGDERDLQPRFPPNNQFFALQKRRGKFNVNYSPFLGYIEAETRRFASF